MSLLDHGPHSIVIHPSTWAPDQDGNYALRPDGSAVTVRARVEPVRSTELVVNGQQLTTLARVIARDLPAGPWDRVEWDGRIWDVLGEPEQYGDSPTTRHVVALIQARGVRHA